MRKIRRFLIEIIIYLILDSCSSTYHHLSRPSELRSHQSGRDWVFLAANMKLSVFLAAAGLTLASAKIKNEIIPFEEAVLKMPKEFHDLKKEVIVSSTAHHLRSKDELPETFTWKSVEGVNYVTRMRNQHSKLNASMQPVIWRPFS